MVGKRLSKNTGKSIGFENTDSMEDGIYMYSYMFIYICTNVFLYAYVNDV
jgi:hypothetical protein